MKSIPYNVSGSHLVLPEYGRHIQNLVDYCVKIEDREKRTRYAFAVADIIAGLFPNFVGEGGNRQKIWDHINIMSGFKLDIDFPVEVITKEELIPNKKHIPYNSQVNYFRHYGKNIQTMIKIISDMDNCVEKDRLIFLVANQMKKLLLMNNPESASDTKVFEDIAALSEGKIMIDAATYRLNEYIDETPAPKNKKKKK